MSMRDMEAINSVRDTPFGYTLSLISGKWKMIILYWLVEVSPIRFNELQRLLGNITYKTLSSQLKELEADGLVDRHEYSLSEKGKSLYPVMEAMCRWGATHGEKKSSE